MVDISRSWKVTVTTQAEIHKQLRCRAGLWHEVDLVRNRYVTLGVSGSHHSTLELSVTTRLSQVTSSARTMGTTFGSAYFGRWQHVQGCLHSYGTIIRTYRDTTLPSQLTTPLS